MKIIFPYSISGELNPKIDSNECLRVVDIKILYTSVNNKRYKLIKFQAIKFENDSTIEYDLYAYKIVWDDSNSDKVKKYKSLWWNDYNTYVNAGLILMGTWIWQVLGQHRINNTRTIFNIAITDNSYAENYIIRHLYYSGYDLIKEGDLKCEYEPYNPHDLSWIDTIDDV